MALLMNIAWRQIDCSCKSPTGVCLLQERGGRAGVSVSRVIRDSRNGDKYKCCEKWVRNTMLPRGSFDISLDKVAAPLKWSWNRGWDARKLKGMRLYTRDDVAYVPLFTRVSCRANLTLLFIHVVIIYSYFVATPSTAKNLLFSIRIEIIVTFTLWCTW